MRSIKFRAYLHDYKTIAEVEFVSLIFNEIIARVEGGLYELELGEYELMQYTGLKDKNGKEIYEGDVVKRTMNDSHINIFTGKVIFHEGTYFIVCGSDCILLCPSYEGEKNEIIGNIYQHPHLLEESK